MLARRHSKFNLLPHSVRRFPNLVHVSLQDTHLCFERQVMALKACRKLKSLSLRPSKPRGLNSNALLKTIAAELTGLTSLDFMGPYQVKVACQMEHLSLPARCFTWADASNTKDFLAPIVLCGLDC